MTPRDHDSALTPSLMDRLTDLEPDHRAETPRRPWDIRNEMRAALCRDLADLLNVRRADEAVNPLYQEAAASMLSFGVRSEERRVGKEGRCRWSPYH